MEFNLEELSTLSDTWWPVVLEYGGKLALALVTLIVGPLYS